MSINAFYSAEVISTGLPQSVPISTSLEAGFAFVRAKNITAYSATSPSATLPVETVLYPNASDTATVGSGISTANALVPVSFTSGGLSVSQTSPMATGSAIAVTSITAANPAVCTCASTASLSSGQVVWIKYATGMQQIAQMPFTIEVLSPTTFSLPYLDASGFASAATAASVVPVINYGSAVAPFTGFITAISASNGQTLVTTSVAQTLQVGQMFQFSVPTLFGGMQKLNLNTGKYAPSNLGGYEVVAYDSSTNTATFNVNSSGFGAFAFPSNATVLTQPGGIIQQAQIGTSGTYWGILTDVGSRNTSTWYVNLGSSVCGRVGDVIELEYGWLAN
jgi:hypothetical protein